MGLSKYERISLAVVFATMLMTQQLLARRLWQTIISDFRLHKMARVLESRGLTSLFDAENVTVYLPSSEGFFQFDAAYYGIGDNDVEKWEELFTYGSQNGKFTLSHLPKQGRLSTRLHPVLSLYVNTFYTPEGQVTTINGATILHADIITDNGVLHIVDRVIAPIGSRLTIAEYLENPELQDLSFRAIILAAIVVPTLTEKTNNSKAMHTSFSPNDSYLYPMPEYGKGPLFNNSTILREVYEAHIIENEAYFLPADVKEIPTKRALFGSIRFYTRDGKMYIVNNRVHAKVIQPNIPTVNGVIHVIDNLLHYVYHNAMQIADSMPDTKIFAQLQAGLTSEQKNRLANNTVTVFIPTDWAFSKVPLYWQAEMLKRENMIDNTALVEVLFGHVIHDSALDASLLYDGRKLTMANNHSLTVLEIEGDIYLETSDKKIRSKIEVTDIGITNGVVHLISNLLYAEGFTVWEALSDIPELKRIHEMIVVNFRELMSILSVRSESSVTAFLPNNEVLLRSTDLLNSLLLTDAQTLYMTLQGHVVIGQLSSTSIAGQKSFVTLSGKVINVTRELGSSTITVAGGHVTSTVVVRDIFCANGVLHIIDDILHTPTRTIDGEMKLRQELTYMQTLFTTLQDDKYDLNSKDDNYTLFIPNNDAFSSLPWDTVSQLLEKINWTKQVLRAHVVKGEVRTLEQIQSGTALPAENNVVYVVKKEGKVFVVNNNMMAEVVASDIPAVNGWIHVIDRILTVPYISVKQVMKSREEVRLFHEMMSDLPEYKELMSSPLRNITLFVPSTRYIKTLREDQLARIKGDMDILRKLFYGHVLPDVRLDDAFLRQYPDADYCSLSAYNVSFKISRRGEDMFVGVGFDIQPLDLIGRATGCSDGIVYVIDGFLNYSPFTVLERLKREPGLSGSFEHMSGLAEEHDINLLDDPNLSFTFMMPDDLALDYFTFNELLHLHSLPEGEQHRTFWRHSINGSTLYYEDLKNGHMSPELLPEEVSVDVQSEAVYLRYRRINSKIKQWNLIACNGVIHILMQFLYEVKNREDDPTTTLAPPVNPSTRMGSLQAGAAVRCSIAVVVVMQFLVLVVLRLRSR